MSTFALVHGYATGLRVPRLRPPLGANAGFSAFDAELARGNASIFRWDIPETVEVRDVVKVEPLISLYERERRLVSDEATHARLAFYLNAEQPEAIVAHSMGCALVWEHLRRHSLPASVRRVVFVQADLVTSPGDLPPLSADLLNLYCPWDPVLMASVLYHRKGRAGLTGLRVRGVQNRLFPLWKPWNLHTSCIRDRRLVACASGY